MQLFLDYASILKILVYMYFKHIIFHLGNERENFQGRKAIKIYAFICDEAFMINAYSSKKLLCKLLYSTVLHDTRKPNRTRL